MRYSVFHTGGDPQWWIRTGGGRVTPAELREKGLKELQADVNFCISSQCRPLKVAEHASTAADFFFQLQSFDAAEEMLDIGVQVRNFRLVFDWYLSSSCDLL